jgi:hypothetical protein
LFKFRALIERSAKNGRTTPRHTLRSQARMSASVKAFRTLAARA